MQHANLKLKIYFKIVLSFFFLLFSASGAYAQVFIGNLFKPAKNFFSVSNLFNVLLPNMLVLTGVLFLVLLIFGGFSFMMGSSSGDPQKAEKGKQAITSAAIGLFLIIGAYFIMALISYIIGIDFLNPEQFEHDPNLDGPLL